MEVARKWNDLKRKHELEEAEFLKRALERNKYNSTHAAQDVSMSRSSFNYFCYIRNVDRRRPIRHEGFLEL